MSTPRTARNWLMEDLSKEHPHARPGDLIAALAEERAEAHALGCILAATLNNAEPKAKAPPAAALSAAHGGSVKPATPAPPEPLDVEALARALNTGMPRPFGWPPEQIAAVAAAYARAKEEK